MISKEYIAGLFDGEGSIGIYATNNGVNTASGGKTYWAARLAIVGTHRPMIESVYKHFGIGQFSTQKRQKKTMTPKGEYDLALCKQGWLWAVTRKQEILYICEQIYPHLIEKSEQVKIAMDFCKNLIDGETASKLCKDAKRFSFPKELGEPLRRSTGSPCELNPSAKLTFVQAEDIRNMVKNGFRQIDLVKQFNVSKNTISNIISNKTYTHKPINYSNV